MPLATPAPGFPSVRGSDRSPRSRFPHPSLRRRPGSGDAHGLCHGVPGVQAETTEVTGQRGGQGHAVWRRLLLPGPWWLHQAPPPPHQKGRQCPSSRPHPPPFSRATGSPGDSVLVLPPPNKNARFSAWLTEAVPTPADAGAGRGPASQCSPAGQEGLGSSSRKYTQGRKSHSLPLSTYFNHTTPEKAFGH